MEPTKPNENQAAPDAQEAPAVSDKLLYGDSSNDLVPYPRKPETARQFRARRDQEQAASRARPLSHLPPGHPHRIAQLKAQAPDQQQPAPPRRFVWQHESDVPTPPMKKRGPRDPRNIG